MNTLKVLWMVPLFSLLPMMPVMAHGDMTHDRIERRIDRQQMRINQGIRSGELTRFEAKKLRKQNRRIIRLKRDYMRDGRLNHRERHALMERLDRASKRIYRMKHNDVYRGHRHGWRGDRFVGTGRSVRLGDGLTLYFGHRGRW